MENEVQNSPTSETSQETIQSTDKPPETSGKKPLFTVALVVLMVSLLGIACFFVYQSYQLKKSDLVVPPQPYPIETKPNPEESIKEIKIIDGNVCQVIAPNEIKILVDKDNFQSESISGFDKLEISPDGTKMCFLGYSLTPIWLYYANIDGSNVIRVGLGKNCFWSHDSMKIALNNHTTDVSPTDIYIHDTVSGKTNNITESSQVQSEAGIIRVYSAPTWLEGDAEISAKFVSFDMSNQTQTSGESIINTTTGDVEDTIILD